MVLIPYGFPDSHFRTCGKHHTYHIEGGLIMQEISIITNRPKFSNKLLEKATITIMSCDNDIKSRQFSIASILAEVEVKKLFADDGFASCAEYAEKTFGIKKSTAYALITIGKDYTRPVLNANGKVIGHCSNLLPPADNDKQDAPLIDFTTRQISIFSTLGREKVLDLVGRNELLPNMTANQIRDLVKAQKALNVSDSELEQEPAQPEPEQTEPVKVGIERPENFDNLSSDILIAELRKRGFKVFRDDAEQVFDW